MNYKSLVLFKTQSSGALRQWRSWSIGNEVYTEHGQVGGKMQTSRDIVQGKNIGRVNATTQEQQASLEAEHLYDAQIKKGYITDMILAKTGANALPAILPMLAHVYEDIKEPIYPAFVQPKLDGIRCIAIVKNGVTKLYTRSQKIIDTVPHINVAVSSLANKIGINTLVLDGELYNHDFKDDFGRILGAVKRKGLGKDSELVHYYVYDVPNELPFSERTHELQHLGSRFQKPLVLVQTQKVINEEDMRTYAAGCIGYGYEGAMYRASAGPYEGKRSRNLLKVKIMRDEEFEVIGHQEGTGKLMGKVGSFICKTKDGLEFRAKLEGALSNLPAFNSPAANKLTGKFLTVRFQNYTPDGIPRFPVGVKFKHGVEL